MFMKFFKWIVEFKLRRLDGEKRINYLANRLIQEVNRQGYSVMEPTISEGFGSLSLYVFDYNTNNAKLLVEKIGKFSIPGKPIVKIK